MLLTGVSDQLKHDFLFYSGAQTTFCRLKSVSHKILPRIVFVNQTGYKTFTRFDIRKEVNI